MGFGADDSLEIWPEKAKESDQRNKPGKPTSSETPQRARPPIVSLRFEFPTTKTDRIKRHLQTMVLKSKGNHGKK